jgi:hypothetical protein
LQAASRQNGLFSEKITTKRAYMLREKRRMQRFPLALPTQIQLEQGNRPTLSLVSRDVCTGGGFYLTDSPLPIGTRVKIKMFVKLGEPDRSDVGSSQISVSGTVIRRDRDGMAVCFDKRYRIVRLRK